jgi:hypothetical protein
VPSADGSRFRQGGKRWHAFVVCCVFFSPSYPTAWPTVCWAGGGPSPAKPMPHTWRMPRAARICRLRRASPSCCVFFPIKKTYDCGGDFFFPHHHSACQCELVLVSGIVADFVLVYDVDSIVDVDSSNKTNTDYGVGPNRDRSWCLRARTDCVAFTSVYPPVPALRLLKKK